MKVKSIQGGGKSQFQRYRDLCYGDTSVGHVIWAELVTFIFGSWPGAAGVFLRSKIYPSLFAEVGGKLLIGRNVTFRHFKKIKLGSGVIVDDNAMVDAKGESNIGITIGDNVFIGRGTIVYCKNGNITLESNVNLSSNCTIFSSNSLMIGAGTMIGAYSYMLSGGEYDYTDKTPFAEQSGMNTKGETIIGRNCWLGARVTILDSARIGRHCVIGAGSLVNGNIEADSLAVGTPAKKIKSI